MKKQLRALFSGSVQGVGFRFTAERIARHFEVTGFVRNLPDGKVEMVAEGEEIVVKDFLKAVEKAMSSCVMDVQLSWSDAEGHYSGFGVAY